MKLIVKIVILSALSGLSTVSLAAPPAAGTPAAKELADCHAKVLADVTRFKGEIKTAIREHSASGVVLKQFADHELAVLAHEKKLGTLETAAACAAEHKELLATNAKLASVIGVARCHAAVRDDVKRFNALLLTAKNEHSTAPAVMKQLLDHEKAVLAQEKKLGTHETLTNCQAEHKELTTNNGLLLASINLGRCHHNAANDIKKLNTDIKTAISSGKLTATAGAALRKHETELVTKEVALKGHETLAQCQALDKELKAMDASVKTQIAAK